MIERANQAEPAPPEPGPEPHAVTGRTGVRYALVGMLIVVGWLVVCMLLRKAY